MLQKNLTFSNIKNPYLETSAWGWQIDVLLVQKSH